MTDNYRHNIDIRRIVAHGGLDRLLDQTPQTELEEYLDLYLALGLPMTLEALKLKDVSDEDLYRVAEAALKERGSIHNLVYTLTPDQIIYAIKAVDVHRAYMEKLGWE